MRRKSEHDNDISFFSQAMFRLRWSILLVLSLFPFFLGHCFWHISILRPILLYSCILPFLWVPIGLLLVITVEVCTQLNIGDKYLEKILFTYSNFLWYPYMRILHGYEISGLKNLPPSKTGALLVYYHALLPIDVLFFGITLFQKEKRYLGGVSHTMLFNIPFIGTFLKMFEFSANREELVSGLKNGGLRCVAPGGEYEALFSQDYELMWRGRCGFARVAKETNVPVIPMFTINSREYIRMHFFGFKANIHRYYEKYRFPMMYVFGGFPVKLKTYLGEPLYCAKDESPEDFAKRVQVAIEKLRDTYQRKNNTVVHALLDRLT